MSNINHVILAGNLTREPEAKWTQSGTCILTFTIAVNESKKNPQGDWEDYANFFDCAVFGRRAEALADMLHKGMKVTVSGRLHWHSWLAEDGSKRSRVTVNVAEVELPQRPRDNSRGGGWQQSSEDVYSAPSGFEPPF